MLLGSPVKLKQRSKEQFLCELTVNNYCDNKTKGLVDRSCDRPLYKYAPGFEITYLGEQVIPS